jgi:mannose-6-phosphate isomerase class I
VTGIVPDVTGLRTHQPRPYETYPCYPAVGGPVTTGWAAAVGAWPEDAAVLAVDGPVILDWDAVLDGLTAVFTDRAIAVEHLDMRGQVAPWAQTVKRTSSQALFDDPNFDKLGQGRLADIFDALPCRQPPAGGVLLVIGPGAALIAHDVLWYADLPKRYAENEVTSGRGRNLGQRPDDGDATTKRLFYIDWPLLDRHRDTIGPAIDRFVDALDAANPTSLDGDTLRRTLADLVTQPFRTRPTFNTTSWGGHWAQRELGVNREEPNTALGYELIAPESGVLIGDLGSLVEVPFQLIVAHHPVDVLGEEVQARFGNSFPIRFDYLDTVGGGNLSVHTHPQPDYMRDVFGWHYTQHESYYVMVGGTEGKIYLGLRDDIDLQDFHREATLAEHHGVAFDIEQHVQTFPAEPHQLYLVPAGTPHGSGEGNVILEVSATPYLYSLRFYDWLRLDAQDNQRPVHVEHAFRNLGTDRLGKRVADDLVREPVTLREDDGWKEELLGGGGELFFDIRRMVIESDDPAPDDTAGRFHILNVVEGDGVLIETATGRTHSLAYAETIVLPAATGAYALRRVGSGRTRVIKSLVR